jgi:hypothetical protein
MDTPIPNKITYGYQRIIKLCWHSAYYDGPISGVCEISGKKFWFDQIKGETGELWVKYVDRNNGEVFSDDDYEYDITRFYRIYDLPHEIMSSLIFNHELFMKYVGHHTDYLENRRTVGCYHNFHDNWDQFKSELKKVDFGFALIDSNCIGWFDSNSIEYGRQSNDKLNT